ncbi:hypothetical protein HDU96_008328 [Phlyctochytrium bullatum]|nr:hypothetical protein HDU96_008328 [Phlyctochytrium bullatum]
MSSDVPPPPARTAHLQTLIMEHLKTIHASPATLRAELDDVLNTIPVSFPLRHQPKQPVSRKVAESSRCLAQDVVGLVLSIWGDEKAEKGRYDEEIEREQTSNLRKPGREGGRGRRATQMRKRRQQTAKPINAGRGASQPSSFIAGTSSGEFSDIHRNATDVVQIDPFMGATMPLTSCIFAIVPDATGSEDACTIPACGSETPSEFEFEMCSTEFTDEVATAEILLKLPDKDGDGGEACVTRTNESAWTQLNQGDSSSADAFSLEPGLNNAANSVEANAISCDEMDLKPESDVTMKASKQAQVEVVEPGLCLDESIACTGAEGFAEDKHGLNVQETTFDLENNTTEPSNAPEPSSSIVSPVLSKTGASEQVTINADGSTSPEPVSQDPLSRASEEEEAIEHCPPSAEAAAAELLALEQLASYEMDSVDDVAAPAEPYLNTPPAVALGAESPTPATPPGFHYVMNFGDVAVYMDADRSEFIGAANDSWESETVAEDVLEMEEVPDQAYWDGSMMPPFPSFPGYLGDYFYAAPYVPWQMESYDQSFAYPPWTWPNPYLPPPDFYPLPPPPQYAFIPVYTSLCMSCHQQFVIPTGPETYAQSPETPTFVYPYPGAVPCAGGEACTGCGSGRQGMHGGGPSERHGMLSSSTSSSSHQHGPPQEQNHPAQHQHQNQNYSTQHQHQNQNYHHQQQRRWDRGQNMRGMMQQGRSNGTGWSHRPAGGKNQAFEAGRDRQRGWGGGGGFGNVGRMRTGYGVSAGRGRGWHAQPPQQAQPRVRRGYGRNQRVEMMDGGPSVTSQQWASVGARVLRDGDGNYRSYNR